MTTQDTRTGRLLESLGIQPASRVASGRYLRSEPIRTGIRYWAGHAHGQDLFGVQFYGVGLTDAKTYRAALVEAGFEPRSAQPTQATFCREIGFLAANGMDVSALQAARTAADAILQVG